MRYTSWKFRTWAGYSNYIWDVRSNINQINKFHVQFWHLEYFGLDMPRDKFNGKWDLV